MNTKIVINIILFVLLVINYIVFINTPRKKEIYTYEIVQKKPISESNKGFKYKYILNANDLSHKIVLYTDRDYDFSQKEFIITTY